MTPEHVIIPEEAMLVQNATCWNALLFEYHLTLWQCRRQHKWEFRADADTWAEPAVGDSQAATWRNGTAKRLWPHVHEELHAQQLQQNPQHTGKAESLSRASS